VQTVRPQGAKLAFLVLRQNKQGYVATIQADHAPRSLSPQTEQPFSRARLRERLRRFRTGARDTPK
jgi:hypothetical protein